MTEGQEHDRGSGLRCSDFSVPLTQALTRANRRIEGLALIRAIEVFAKKITRNGITASGASFLEPQRLANAPYVDDSSWSGFELAGGMPGKSDYGRFFPGSPEEIYLANDIANTQITIGGKSHSFTAFQIKQKGYVHEMANRLSYMLTGDTDFFREPGPKLRLGPGLRFFDSHSG